MKKNVLKSVAVAILTMSYVSPASALVANSMSAGIACLVITVIGIPLTAGGMLGTIFLDKTDGMVALTGGMLLLDAETNIVHYQPLNWNQKKEIGLTKEEFAAFNSKLPYINLALDETSDELRTSMARNGGMPPPTSEIAGMWSANAADAQLSAPALSAVQKVSKFVIQKAARN